MGTNNRRDKKYAARTHTLEYNTKESSAILYIIATS